MKSVRAYLVSMSLVLVVLVCAAAAFLIREVELAGRRQAQAQLLGTARALSTAADGIVDRATSILVMLRNSEALQRRDWREVDRQARLALPEADAWVVAADRSGRQLVNTRMPAGTALPTGSNPTWLWPLLDRGRPRVCDLTKGYVEPRIVCVDLPVMEGGRAAYALSVIMRPKFFGTMIARQHVGGDGVATLVDRRGRVIWRSLRAEHFVGKPMPPAVRPAITQQRAGLLESKNLDGVQMLAAFSRSPVTGWAFVVGVPSRSIQAGGVRALSYGLIAAFALLAIGAVIAFVVAQHLTRAIRGLADAANAFRDQRPPPPRSSGLAEIEDVGLALDEAFAAREANDERFRLAQDIGGIGAWDWDVLRDEGHVSDTYKEMHGLSAIAGPLRMEQVLAVIHPDDLQGYLSRLAAARGRSEPSTNEYRVVRPDGSVRWVAAKGRPIVDADGRYVRALGVVRDVTAEREAQEAMRLLNQDLEARVEARTADLRQAEDALRQSQKLESMGQLTGGVAHDFNNLLTPIVGSLDMLQRRGVGGEREARLIDGALQSAEKAKVLVQRLLAFARRQPLQPVAVDLGRLVEGMTELVASTSGPRIRVQVEIEPDLPPVRADPNQVEMAILNLAVNARDAMPGGGTLSISARAEQGPRGEPALPPGPYVCLVISDTGVGMDEETRARAIEPFFSTKGVGQGTGLGLSMVHGLAAQLGGALAIDSRPGLGTSIALWLPVASERPNEAAPGEPAGPEAASGTVLLVDDDQLARASTAEMLAELGYAVVEAGSAEEALRLAEAGIAFDLLVTDHLMPGLSGAELAGRVTGLRPGTPVLIVSGYADVEGIAPHLNRLAKPFRQADLANSLAQLVATQELHLKRA